MEFKKEALLQKMQKNLQDFFDSIFEKIKEALQIQLSIDEFEETMRRLQGSTALAIKTRKGHGDWAVGISQGKVFLGTVSYGYGDTFFHADMDLPLQFVRWQEDFLVQIRKTILEIFEEM